MSDNPELKLASQVSHRVDLQDLRTTHLQFDLHRGATGRLQVGLETDIASAIEPGVLIYEVRFTLTLTEQAEHEGGPDADSADTDEQTGGGPVLTAEVHLALLYATTDDFEPDDDQQDAFGRLSVMHTAYPYLRETLHTLTMRAGLPPLVVGSFLAPMSTSSD